MQTLTTPLKLCWSIDRITNDRVDEKIVHFGFAESVFLKGGWTHRGTTTPPMCPLSIVQKKRQESLNHAGYINRDF